MDRLDNIDYCIRYLKGADEVELPPTLKLKEKQQVLRALMNVWEPRPLSDAFLKAQDAELQAQLADKGVVSPDEEKACQEGDAPSPFSLWKGDITRLKVDAIVNAANSRGLGCWHPLHSCIDNAIHSAAGLQLRQECNSILQGAELSTGKAIITSGYNLPCRYVIHTVGPIVPDGVPTAVQERQLAECYRSSLHLAVERGCHTIAFCCISTGEFHFPNRRAAEIAVATCRNSPVHVIFNVFKDIDYAIYSELVRTY